MSQHDAFLDRMTGRLGEISAQIDDLSRKAAQHGDAAREKQVRELETSLAVARERLQAMRRSGGELDEEATRTFAQSFERLNNAVGVTRAALEGHAHPS